MTVKHSIQKKFVSVDAPSVLIVNQLACAWILVKSVYCGCNTKIIAFKSELFTSGQILAIPCIQCCRSWS